MHLRLGSYCSHYKTGISCAVNMLRDLISVNIIYREQINKIIIIKHDFP